MKFTPTLTMHADSTETTNQQVFSMGKDCQYLDDVGLLLAESKQLMENLQQAVVH
ncbi:hypothetical protein [Larkinella humicola]|uniref:hypothetical protein n=1 Tax=Larkinella humicola TaxID=2607654 RepID=UPI0017869306|nr:hypothetical protein [Larkinella humicola]